MPLCDLDKDNEQQIEYASVKFLLKQVYSAHINKVKSLEDDLRAVKEELENAKKELNDYKASCKQCKELQDAFSACKFALMEQTRWFENLGEKFSHKEESSRSKMANSSKSSDETPNISEHSKHELFTKDIQSNIDVPEQLKNIKFEGISSQLFSPSEMQTLHFSSEKAVAASSQNQRIIVNVPDMFSQISSSVNSDQSSLSRDAETFNSESFVLVPDSVDIFTNGNTEREIIDISSPKVSVVSKLSEITPVLSDDGGSKTIFPCDAIKKVSKQKPEPGKKRQLSDSSDGEVRISKHNRSINNYIPPAKIELKSNHTQNKTAVTNLENVAASQNRVDLLLLSQNKAFSKQKNSKKSPETHCSQNKSVKKNNHLKALDIRICSANDNVAVIQVEGKNKKNDAICLNDKASHSVNSTNSVNPTSLITNVNKKICPTNNLVPEDISSDNDDFQSSVTNSNYPNDTCASNVCDKKKLIKKSAKALKFRSKYKMTLDSPPLNYKKPNHKQTKLSADYFKSKSSQESAQQNRNEAKKQTTSSPLVHEIFIKSKAACSMDFDATCIPENFKYGASPNSHVLGDIGNICRSPEKNIRNLNEELATEKSYKETVSQDLLAANVYSFKKNSPNLLSIDGESDDDDIAFEDIPIKSKGITDSFDRIPVPDEPNYKYKEETIRNKAQRKQLAAFECKECEKYFSELELTDEEKQERLKHCSRHRAKFLPPATPDHFWELEFPDTQECKVRGYQAETQKVELKSRRRRPLT